MTVRGIPGALVLGLLASLLAHSALYGGAHAMGGTYHDILIELASGGCGGFIVLLVTLPSAQGDASVAKRQPISKVRPAA